MIRRLIAPAALAGLAGLVLAALDFGQTSPAAHARAEAALPLAPTSATSQPGAAGAEAGSVGPLTSQPGQGSRPTAAATSQPQRSGVWTHVLDQTERYGMLLTDELTLTGKLDATGFRGRGDLFLQTATERFQVLADRQDRDTLAVFAGQQVQVKAKPLAGGVPGEPRMLVIGAIRAAP